MAVNKNYYGKQAKCCFILPLRQGVLFSTCLSWLFWMGAILFYIPYNLMYSPQEPQNPDDPNSQMVPTGIYASIIGPLSATVIIFGIFVDSLLIAAVQSDVKTDLFYPWFIFYALVIPGLIAVAAIAPIYGTGYVQYMGLASGILAVLYILLYTNVSMLFRTGQLSTAFLQGFSEAILNPIAERVKLLNDNDKVGPSSLAQRV